MDVHRIGSGNGELNLENRLKGLELAMDNLPVAIGVFALDGCPVYLNRPFCDLYDLHWWQEDGVSFERMIECGIFRHWRQDPHQHFREMLEVVSQGRTFTREIDIGGRIISIHNTLIEGRYILSTQQDVAARVEAEAQILFMASHDPLTQLLNRAGFVDEITALMKERRVTPLPFAIISMDLDLFKDVNDVFGHGAGDAVLVAVADRLRAKLSGGDFCGRLGGDEFTFVRTATADRAAVEELACSLRDAVLQPVLYRDNLLRVGVSIGAAIFPEDSEDAAELFARADMALYRAKERRHGVCLFDADVDTFAHERRMLRNRRRTDHPDPESRREALG